VRSFLRQNTGLFLLLLCATTFATEDKPALAVHERNRTAVNELCRKNTEKYKDNADMLVLSGLLADRKHKRVLIQAEATGIGRDVPVEFFLIGQNSGHDYEALAVSFARPSDIHKALVFIGMTPGRPCNPAKFHFWPKGERVLMTFASYSACPSLKPVRTEKLILDRRTGKALPDTGLVFTGSLLIDSAGRPGVKVYAANTREPNSIASNYNERESVLDVPRQAPQSAVYGEQSANPEFLFPSNSLLQVVMEPEYTDGKIRTLNLLLTVNVQSSPTGTPPSRLAFSLLHVDGRKFYDGPEPHGVLHIFASLIENGHDPFVTVRFDGKLPLAAVQDLCLILSTMEKENGIRVEPLPGHPYYKAFLPDPRFRDRTGRISQPWELHLSMTDSGISGILTQIEQVWRDGRLRPDLDVTDYDVPTPGALRKELARRGPGLPVIFVFAQPALTYGHLLDFLSPVLTTHPAVHVFFPEKAREHR